MSAGIPFERAAKELARSHYDVMAALDDAGVPGGGDVAARVRAVLAERDALLDRLAPARRPTDRERLLASLDEDRTETLMALADAALDEGREGEARGWGWLAMHRKWPEWNRGSWGWKAAYYGSHAPRDHCLPVALFAAMGGAAPRSAGGRWNCHPTCRPALQAVVDTIESGVWVPEMRAARPAGRSSGTIRLERMELQGP